MFQGTLKSVAEDSHEMEGFALQGNAQADFAIADRKEIIGRRGQ
jgi:hypothetical protein